MDKEPEKELIGQLDWTKKKIQENISQDWWGCDVDHYPQAFDASVLNRAAVWRRRKQCSTFADCILVPDTFKSVTMDMVSNVENISWLNRREDSSMDVLRFINRTREKHQLLLLIPVLDRGEYDMTLYDKKLPVVCYVLANRTEAVVVQPELEDTMNIMRNLLQSGEIVKVILNHEYEWDSLMVYYATHVNLVFSIKKAMSDVMRRLNLNMPITDDNPMVSLSLITRINLPIVSECVYKTEKMLAFAEAVFRNMEFLVRFKRHEDNVLALHRFGMDWKIELPMEGLLDLTPSCLVTSSLVTAIKKTGNGCENGPYFIAAWLYCTSPLLLTFDDDDNLEDQQKEECVPQVYREFLSLSKRNEGMLEVKRDCCCSKCTKMALVNWIKFHERVEQCVLKYKCIASMMEFLSYHAPLFCLYIQCYNTN